MKTLKYIIIVSLSLFYGLSSQAQDKKVVTSEFEVIGVCEMCKDRIENAALIKGVKFAEWNKETGIVKVVYVPKKTSLETIQNAIAKAGHDTDLVKADDEDYKKLPKCCAYRDDVEKH